MDDDDEGQQVEVEFHTQLKQEFRVPATPFAVPLRLTRLGLSEIINHLLKREQKVTFDFLVDGELLRTSLEAHLLQRSISTESVVRVEYLFLPSKPEPDVEAIHDEWVTCLSVEGSVIASGSFDGGVRLWSDEGEEKMRLDGSTEGVTSVAWVSDEHGSGVVAASRDHALYTWLTDLSDTPSSSRCQRFMGHQDTVTAVSVGADKTKFISASADKSIKLWGANMVSKAGVDVGRKKRRDAAGATGTEFKDTGPLATLLGHTQPVSTIKWSTSGEIVSGGFDHTVRLWDLETGQPSTTLNGSRVVTSLDVHASNGIVVTGHPDRSIRLWDTRATDGSVVKKTLSGHKGWVSDVAWASDRPHTVLSSSYDHSVRVWDIRASVPLHTIVAHTDKALCASWMGSRPVSGGADGKLRVFSPLPN